MRAAVVILLCALALPLIALAQANRFYDRLTVTFDKPVTVNTGETIPAGKYTFQQLRMVGHPNVFDVRDNTGKHVALTATAHNALYSGAAASSVPGQTQIILKDVGSKRYLDKIWFIGQNNGYKFDLVKNPPNTASNLYGSSKTASAKKETSIVPVVREIVVLAVPVAVDTSKKSEEASRSDTQDNSNPPATNTNRSAQAQDQQGALHIQGCVTGPYGGSYMLASTNGGQRYKLLGDSDDIRENLGRVVTISAVPSTTQAPSNDKRPAGHANSDTSQVATSPSRSESVPVAVTVRSIQKISEICDKPIS